MGSNSITSHRMYRVSHKERTFLENHAYWVQILVNFRFQYQFWKIQDLRISKLTLKVKIRQEMAEKNGVKDAYPIKKSFIIITSWIFLLNHQAHEVLEMKGMTWDNVLIPPATWFNPSNHLKLLKNWILGSWIMSGLSEMWLLRPNASRYGH